ncbi:MAG: hypothetical protein WC455_27645 [Dehalococcoidia bacterium]|jgi:hypothetical protein
MSIIKMIDDCGMLPAWYGIAWRDRYKLGWVCLPVGLNTIARIILRLITFIKYGGTTVHILPREQYRQGWRDGYRTGLSHRNGGDK